MPSRIDRGARFDRIAEAAARVVAAEGLAAASLRRVAAEAGLPLHAVRHLMPDQDTLHQRTAKWLRRRAWEEQMSFAGCTTSEQLLRRLLEDLVPRSDEARMRARAWAAFRRDARPASEYSPPGPDDLDASVLHVLVLAAGLTSLLAEHRVPLGHEALGRWLRHLEPRHLDLPA